MIKKILLQLKRMMRQKNNLRNAGSMTGKIVPFMGKGHTIPPVISGMFTSKQGGIIVI